MGTFHLCGGVGSILFALIGGLLVSTPNGKLIYLLGAIICLVTALVAYLLFRCRKPSEPL